MGRMKEAERDALRARVQAQPADTRGELARTLMAEIDRLYAEKDERDRTSLIGSLVHGEHITYEEAVRYVDTKPLPKLEMEMGPCRACGGCGISSDPVCMGGRWTRCESCSGDRTRMRLRLPWAPHGEVVPLGR